jgi:hypothetical protein
MTLVRFFFKSGGAMEYLTTDSRAATEAQIALWLNDPKANVWTSTTPQGTFLISKEHVVMTLVTEDPKPIPPVPSEPPQPPVVDAVPVSEPPVGSEPNGTAHDNVGGSEPVASTDESANPSA